MYRLCLDLFGYVPVPLFQSKQHHTFTHPLTLIYWLTLHTVRKCILFQMEINVIILYSYYDHVDLHFFVMAWERSMQYVCYGVNGIIKHVEREPCVCLFAGGQFRFSLQSVCRLVAQFLKTVWSFISLKAQHSPESLRLIKENRQINESCCRLALTQPTSITSTTDYITPPAVYIQHLGNHCSVQSHGPTASWMLHWSTYISNRSTSTSTSLHPTFR